MVQIDSTCYIHKTAVIIGDVIIGKHCGVFPHAVLRGDENRIEIGEGTNIQDGCVVHVSEDHCCIIGSNVSVGHLALIHGATIEDDCIIGMHATVMNNALIGRGSIVGAGAVVTQDTVIPPNSLVLGVPAKVVKKDQNFHTMILKNAEIYRELSDKHGRGAFESYQDK